MIQRRTVLGSTLSTLALCGANFLPFVFRDSPHEWPSPLLVAAMKRGLLHPLDQRGWTLVVFTSWIAWAVLFVFAYASLRRAGTVSEGAIFGLLMGLFAAIPQALMVIGTVSVPPGILLFQAGVSLGVAVVDGIVAAAIFGALAGPKR